MQAIVQERFGPASEVYELTDVETPTIGPGDVLVRVHAAGLNPYDWHMVRGDPFVARLMGVGLRRPKDRIAGVDGAGSVEAVGSEVRGVRPGDEVVGFLRGSFAEYASASAKLVVPKPIALTFDQAATLPIAATTALRAIRDVGRVSSGQKVLVNGASGGVGHFAVQIAAARGAEVTGVCSTRNVEMVRSLGAAHVVDYTREDFTDRRGYYDVILDNQGNRPLRLVRQSLTPTGVLALNGGGSPGHVFGAAGDVLKGAVTNIVVRHRIRFVPAVEDREQLLSVVALVDEGTLTPVVDRTFPLADAATGVHHIEEGHSRGKAVVSIG